MKFWINVLNILDTQMETPSTYGWFHLLWLVVVAASTVFLCTRFRHVSGKQIRRTVFCIAVLTAVLEIYKQINYTFRVSEGGIAVDYQWYAFPGQFCSTPMYVGLLTGLFRKGKVHDALVAYLASFSVFAGICVMIYPGNVYVGTVGVNIETMICHGSMIVIGIWLLATGYVRPDKNALRRAAAVFAVAVCAAIAMNEIAYFTGLTAHEDFNMFFISRHCEPSLPVYSLVQQAVPYPWCLLIYVAAFSAAAGLVLLVAAGVQKCARREAVKSY